MRRTGLRTQSKKRRTENRARARLRVVLWEARGPLCEACPVTPVGQVPPRPWLDMHEVLSRDRGGNPLDPAGIKLLCRICHDWVTTHPTAATELGLLRSRTPVEHAAATNMKEGTP